MDYLNYLLILLILLIKNYSAQSLSGINHKYISKCCPKLYYVSDSSVCVHYDSTVEIPDFADVDIYDNSLTKVNKTVKDLFLINYGNMHNQSVEKEIFHTYLIEDGSLYLEVALPNTYQRGTEVPNNLFCVDYVLSENKTVPELRYWYTPEEKPIHGVAFQVIALSVSAIILTMTLVVFIHLEGFRGMFTRIQLAMVISLVGAFSMIAVQIIVTSSVYSFSCNFCLATTFFIYIFLLSSFCWMNVIGIHLCCQLRSDRNLLSNEACSFWYYCGYAWGIPLAMGIVLLALNQSTLNDMPWFIKPNIPLYGCFLSGYEKFFYLYVPLLILLLCNWIVLLFTAFKVKRIQNLKEIYGVKYRSRFLKYLQLSIVLSVAWIFEIVDFKTDDVAASYFVETSYMVLSMAIFFIICSDCHVISSLTNRLFGKRKTEPEKERNKELYPLAGQD